LLENWAKAFPKEVEEMPPGLEERLDSSERIYYANHLTRNTQWNRPCLDQPAPDYYELPVPTLEVTLPTLLEAVSSLSIKQYFGSFHLHVKKSTLEVKKRLFSSLM
jgi:hypothetical protein